MQRRPITNKQEMYRLYESVALGNRPCYWKSFNDYWRDTFRGPVGIRSKITDGPCVYDLAGSYAALSVMEMYVADGYRQDQFIVSEMAPHETQTIQGEVMCSDHHISMTYTDVRLPMRPALAQIKTKYGFHPDWPIVSI
mgnify:FL=1